MSSSPNMPTTARSTARPRSWRGRALRLIGRPWPSGPATPPPNSNRRAAGLDQAVRRRDDGAGTRSGSRTHQEGLLLGAGSRRPAVVRPGAAGGGVQLCPGARWRPRRGAAEGLFGRAANRRLFRLSQPRQSQARRWPGDARLLPSRRGCCHPRPSQTRTSGFPASGSSRASFAHGPAYWWTIKAGGSGYRPSMARKRIHGRWLWRPRRASHFFQIRRSWWWYQRTRRPFPVMP